MNLNTDQTLGFLGYGNMGSAILEGLVKLKVWPAERAVVFDPSEERQALGRTLGVEVADSPQALAATSDVLVLAVKPQVMGDALAEIKDSVKPGTLAISIAAGVSIGFIADKLGGQVRVARVMPNTPCLAHAGAAGIALGPGCTEDDETLVAALFNTIGMSVLVQESELDAVTAVSGSGPAYFFYLVECLTQAGVEEGLSEDVAQALAAQTLYGAGRLLHSSEDDAAELRRKVTSPGGTTAAALAQYEADDLAGVVRRAVKAAADRSRELGQ